MQNNICNQVLIVILLLMATFSGANGQVITAGEDSTVIRRADDSVAFYQVNKWSEPGKVALMSAVIPGLGQAYNKSYWKIPIIYAGGIGLGYAIISNHNQYISFRRAYEMRTDGDSTTIDEYVGKYNQVATLSKGRDQYRRWRDLSILYSFLAYGINIAEAYVYAHLKNFDISDELSMQVHPDIMQPSPKKFIPAFTLSFNLKK